MQHIYVLMYMMMSSLRSFIHPNPYRYPISIVTRYHALILTSSTPSPLSQNRLWAPRSLLLTVLFPFLISVGCVEMAAQAPNTNEGTRLFAEKMHFTHFCSDVASVKAHWVGEEWISTVLDDSSGKWEVDLEVTTCHLSSRIHRQPTYCTPRHSP